MRSKNQNKSLIYKTLVASTLLQYFPFTKDELNELLKKAVIRNFKRNQTVLAIGEVEQHISIIHRGIARKYLVDHFNRQITTEIATQGDVICSNSSIGKVTQSFYGIQAIENLILISFTLDSLFELCVLFPTFFEFVKRVVGISLSKIEEREIILAKYDAQKRFGHFFEKYPEMYERVPQKYLASYLNIRPQTLSKVKKAYISEKLGTLKNK